MMPDIMQSADFAKMFIDTQKDMHTNPDKYRGHPFPMKWFMDRTGGFGRNWYTIVLGKAKSGKTSVLSTAAAFLGCRGVPFMWFGIEEGLMAIGARIFAIQSAVSRLKFRDITLEKKDWPSIYDAANDISKFNATWCYGVKTAAEMAPLLTKHVPQVIFVDYIQLMSAPGFKSKTEEISAISKFLLDVSNGVYTGGKPVAVIAAAQKNDDGQPLWCRDLTRDCDLALGINGIDDGIGGELPDKRKFVIEISRHGECDSTTVGFIGARSMICELQNPPIQKVVP